MPAQEFGRGNCNGAKSQTRWTGFDDKIISKYAREMTTGEIHGHLEEMHGIEVSPTLISNVAEAVIEEVKAWQAPPLEEVWRRSWARITPFFQLPVRRDLHHQLRGIAEPVAAQVSSKPAADAPTKRRR